MAKREIDFLVDPWGVLLGMWRRYKGTADGQPPPTEQRIMLWEQAQLFKYVDRKLDELIREHPKEPEPLLARAGREIEDEQWEKLLATSSELRQRFPSHVSGFRHASWALRRLKRVDEADEIAKRTMRRFPRSYVGWEAWASCATDRGDLVEAEQRWREMRARFPEKAFSHTMHALSLVKLGEILEADEILAAAAEAFPDNSTLRREFAISAERLGEWAEAAERWLDGRGQFEREPIFHIRAALALLGAGDPEEAEDVVASAEFLFPSNAELQSARKKVDAALAQGRQSQA